MTSQPWACCQEGKPENHFPPSESARDSCGPGEGKSLPCRGSSTVRRWQSGLPWIVALILVLLACHLTYKIAYFPQAWGDEQDQLSYDYRYAAFGDRVNLTWISESYNQRGLPKLPLPWASWLRSLSNKIIGCSSFSGRMFSVAMILGSLLITTVISPIRHGLAPWGVLVLLMAGAVSPSLYFAARTIRLEQEILLIGCLSLFLLPCLLQRRQSSRVNLLIWSVSGCLSGYAGACHPCGYVFTGVQLVNLLLLGKAWKQIDGLSAGRRLFGWLTGVAVPVAMQTGLYAWDWSNWRPYLTDTALRFAEVKKSLVDWWAPQWPYRLGSSPRWLAATLYAFKLAAISPYMTLEGSFLLVLLFVGQAIACLGASVFCLVRRWPCDSKELLAVTAVWLAGGFVFCHFAYAILLSPNYTCYPYLGLFVPVGFSWIMIQVALRLKNGSTLWSRRCTSIPLVAAVLCILLYLIFSFHQTLWLTSAYAKGKLTSFDDHLEAMAQTGKKLGWADDNVPVYYDNYTWRAAGPNWKSLFEVSFNEKWTPAAPEDRISFSDSLYDQVFNYPNWGRQTAPSERLERIRHLFRDRTLSALVFAQGDEYHFWEPVVTRHGQPFWVGRITGPRKVLWAKTIPPDLVLEAKDGKLVRDNLEKGWYIMLMKGISPGGSCFRMVSASGDGREAHEEHKFCTDSIHHEVPKALLVVIRQPSTRIVIEAAPPLPLPQGVQFKMLPLSQWSKD